jgi:O-methyltransferase domain
MTEISPQHALLRITGNVLLARCIGIAAEIGLADAIETGHSRLTTAALAKLTGSDESSLYRMLRYMAANGIFAEDAGGIFRNTDMSALLRTGVPGSLRAFVRQSWQDVMWDVCKAFPHTIATGEPAFTKAFGADFFTYLAAHTDIGQKFDAAMAIQSGPENTAVAAAYPFEQANVVVDVGGGRGGFMAAILKAYPTIRGVLFDQAYVLAQPNAVKDAGLAYRCTFEAGDFFQTMPKGGDVYVLKRILHDWDDDTAVRILKTCARAMSFTARVVVVDAVIKPGNDPDPNKALDVSIMSMLKGRERTAQEFAQIYEAAGLRLTRIIATPAPSTMSLVEGVIG